LHEHRAAKSYYRSQDAAGALAPLLRLPKKHYKRKINFVLHYFFILYKF
jgi:hypothetical protein